MTFFALFLKGQTYQPFFCTKVPGYLLLLLCWLYAGKLGAQSIPNEGYDLSAFSTQYYSIPFVDLNDQHHRQVVVDREAGQYLGHPSTVLLDDGQTIYCVYPKGHGRGPLVMKRSTDGGLSWSQRLEVPPGWASSLEVPTLFPVEDAAGKRRIIMFSGLYPARMAITEDEGRTWTDLAAVGDWGGIVVMGDVMELNTGKGHYMAMFHDDQRFFTHNGRSAEEKNRMQHNQPLFSLYKTFSYDGGLSWSYPQAVWASRMVHLCEPGLLRSPDGRQIAALLRENSRRMNSHIIFSEDEGKTWSAPRELPNALTGDRHQALYLPDGRLFISFRDNSPGLSRFRQLKSACSDCDEAILRQQAGPVSPTAGDWVAWVGTYEDLLQGREGQYRIRLKDNTRGSDCAYPALELLPDGTVVATTYGHWEVGEAPYILSVRFKIEELDALVKKP
ncbi:MAG: exo-alpha-sialidase [Bacteroidetes bacterium]|nr:MAG: exo-alpha-sialidase [Bacteroidota bacterium]